MPHKSIDKPISIKKKIKIKKSKAKDKGSVLTAAEEAAEEETGAGAAAAETVVEEVPEIEFNNKDKKYKWLGTYNIDAPFDYGGRTYVTIEHAICIVLLARLRFSFSGSQLPFRQQIFKICQLSFNSTFVQFMKVRVCSGRFSAQLI